MVACRVVTVRILSGIKQQLHNRGMPLLRGKRSLNQPTWVPFASAVLILLSVLPGTINLGIRHILIILALLSIPAGLVLSRLLLAASKPLQVAGALLLLWRLAAGIRAHPNYITYFNELALEPEYIRVDSDLDWGQSAGHEPGPTSAIVIER